MISLYQLYRSNILKCFITYQNSTYTYDMNLTFRINFNYFSNFQFYSHRACNLMKIKAEAN